MKKFLRATLALLLVLCLLPVHAFASEIQNRETFNQVASMIDAFEQKIGVQKANMLCAEVIESDLENLYSVGLYRENIAICDVEDNLITYQITFANEVKNQIRIKEKNDGGLYLYITEGTIHDVVYFTNNMDIFVNGKEIRLVEVDENRDSLRTHEKGNDGEASSMQANMRNVEWRSTPFTGYPYSAFKAVGTLVHPKKELTFNQLIKNTATATISSVLSAGICLILSNHVSVATFLTGIGVSMAFDNIASQCKEMAERYAPNAESILTTVRRHELKTKPATNDIYYRYRATFELLEDNDSNQKPVDFYYHNYFS